MLVRSYFGNLCIPKQQISGLMGVEMFMVPVGYDQAYVPELNW